MAAGALGVGMSKRAVGAVMIAVGVVLNGGIGLLMALNGDIGRALVQGMTAVGVVVGGVTLRGRDSRRPSTPAGSSARR